jgi:hypothetical protein
LTILQNSGFTILAPSVNPRVKDRVNAVNGVIVLSVQIDTFGPESKRWQASRSDGNAGVFAIIDI